MAKKKPPKSTDAERRARQCERLSRVLRTLQCIMSKGRWDAERLAQELEVSPRTIHRILQTLSMAGVPYHFDNVEKSYRVRPGFKFPGLEPDKSPRSSADDLASLLPAAKRVLDDGGKFLSSLQALCDALDQSGSSDGRQ